jgi:hypothetical protein
VTPAGNFSFGATGIAAFVVDVAWVDGIAASAVVVGADGGVGSCARSPQLTNHRTVAITAAVRQRATINRLR